MPSFLQTVKVHYWILLILLFAFLVRVWDVGDNPPGFFRDEADKALTARSLLTTGRDLEGRPMPFFVRSLGVYTSGVYQYVLLPFVLLLGTGQWVIRLPAVLAGTATVFVTYLLGREAYDRRTGLLAAALLAISPWHVQFSRWANQGIFLPLALALGCYFLLRGRGPQAAGGRAASARGTSLRPWLLSAVCLAASLYTYAPAKLFLPLFFGVLAVIYWRDLFVAAPDQRWPRFYKVAGLILLLSLPMLAYTVYDSGRSSLRFNRVSIFHSGGTVQDFAFLFARNYLAHFSPSFLLWQGDANLRHSPPQVGQLLKPEAVLLVLGVYGLLRRRRREDWMLLAWLALGPLPASMTHEGIPHALRSIAILPAVQLIAAVGGIRLYDYFVCRERRGVIQSDVPRKMVSIVLIAAFGIFGGLYLVLLFGYYPQDSAPAWEYGYGQTIHFVEQHRKPGQEVVFSRWAPYAETHVLYQTKGDLRAFQKTQTIPGYRFLKINEPTETDFFVSPGRSLYVLTPLDRIDRQPLYTVRFPDGSMAWRVVERP